MPIVNKVLGCILASWKKKKRRRGQREEGGREKKEERREGREIQREREGNSSEKRSRLRSHSCERVSTNRDGDSSACAVVGDSSSVTSKPLSY